MKNQAKANAYRRLSSPFFIMFQLLVYDGLGDWKYINTYADEVDAVTAADLQRVAQQLPHEGEPHGRRLPAQGGRRAAPRTRRSRRCPRRRRPWRGSSLQQIEAETDAAKLREGIAQMQQAAGAGAAGDEAGARADR